MQIHCSLERRLELAFTARRRDYGGFAAPRAKGFLDRMRQCWMRAEFEPDIDAEIRECVYRWREPHRLANAASPVSGITGFAGQPPAGHGTEKRNCFGLRFQIGKRGFQRLGRRMH